MKHSDLPKMKLENGKRFCNDMSYKSTMAMRDLAMEIAQARFAITRSRGCPCCLDREVFPSCSVSVIRGLGFWLCKSLSTFEDMQRLDQEKKWATYLH